MQTKQARDGPEQMHLRKRGASQGCYTLGLDQAALEGGQEPQRGCGPGLDQGAQEGGQELLRVGGLDRGLLEGRRDHDRKDWRPRREELRYKPWNGWLAFFDPDLETEFWSMRVASLLRGMDCGAFCYGLLYFSGMALQFAGLQGKALIIGHQADGFLVLFLVFVAWAAAESYRWSDRYRRHRSAIVGSVRVLSIIFSSRYTSMFDPQIATVGAFFGVLIRKSTLTVLVISPLVLQLPFAAHTAVNSASLLAALLWATPSYCEAWTGSKAFAQVATKLEKGINTLLMLGASAQVDPKGAISSEQSCWLVVAFLHVAVGFVVPTAIVYGTETLARSKYLRQRFPAMTRFCLPEPHGLVILIVGMVVVASTSTWLGLRAFLELGEDELNFGCSGTS